MVAQAHVDDAIECSVGLAVAPSIESAAVGPALTGGDRLHTAQGGGCGLRPQSFWIASPAATERVARTVPALRVIGALLVLLMMAALFSLYLY